MLKEKAWHALAGICKAPSAAAGRKICKDAKQSLGVQLAVSKLLWELRAGIL